MIPSFKLSENLNAIIYLTQNGSVEPFCDGEPIFFSSPYFLFPSSEVPHLRKLSEPTGESERKFSRILRVFRKSGTERPSAHLHINIHSARQTQICQSFDDFRRRTKNINKSLMNSHLKLFSRVLVNKG